MKLIEVKVPDVGVEGDIEVIEICIKVGDELSIDSPLVVLESDKATVEVPCVDPGKVNSVLVKVGDKVSEGSLIMLLEPNSVDSGAEDTAVTKLNEVNSGSSNTITEVSKEIITENKQGTAAKSDVLQEILVPDLGGSELVEVIEVLVSERQSLAQDETLIVLESDKATMEIPSPYAGELKELQIKVGDQVSEGDVIGKVLIEANLVVKKDALTDEDKIPTTEPMHDQIGGSKQVQQGNIFEQSNANIHAGPAVRKLARELGADIAKVQSSGPKGRVLKDDLTAYIKSQVKIAQNSGRGGQTGALPEIRLPDFSSFGEVETLSMDKIQRLTAENMHASWVNVPHVTQFDEADITELEIFRKQQKMVAEKKGVKLTPMAFLVKACAYALNQLPQFNVSLDMHEHKVIQKKYIHIGIAVDTPNGLVVPVIRNVDSKSLWELAEECQTLAIRARVRKLKPAEMQGGCFTISSLGGVGGTAFTPIVNTPEVAILGVSRSQYKPVFDGNNDFIPRLMLPLSLSYDHRAVNGADAARFTSLLGRVLGDLRELLL